MANNHSSLNWISGTQRPKKMHITRVLNYGTWDEWFALKKRFSPSEIQNAVERPLKGQWTKRGKAFAETLFNRLWLQSCILTSCQTLKKACGMCSKSTRHFIRNRSGVLLVELPWHFKLVIANPTTSIFFLRTKMLSNL
jgi:hypothetical protein